jgi:hypothetical protein
MIGFPSLGLGEDGESIARPNPRDHQFWDAALNFVLRDSPKYDKPMVRMTSIATPVLPSHVSQGGCRMPIFYTGNGKQVYETQEG